MTQPTPPHADLARLRIDRDAPPPAVQGAVIRNLVLLLVVVAAIAIGWWYLRERAVPQVEVATVGAPAVAGSGGTSGVTSVTANGYVVARTKASVSAKAAGRLDYLGVSEGSFVERGTVIARLDNAEFQAGIAQAKANLAATEATLIEATADRDQSVREAVRQRDVRAQNPNLVSPQELDAVNSRASFTGTVLRKDAEVGEVVAPSVGGGLTRGAVVTMADLSTLEVEVDVNEAYIARITKGLRARITLDAYPDTSFRGSVRQVVPTADRQRATVQVKVSITDRDARILPEMGAKVDFLQPEVRSADAGRDVARPVVRVPQAAVREDGGKSVVWIVRDGRLVRREIEAGPVSAGFREVRSGLTGGELVVIGGVDSPTEGQRVKIGQ